MVSKMRFTGREVKAGERAWQLPMDRDFEEALKSNVADCKNAPRIRYGGAITAAKFLEQFVGKTPWAHLDISGPAWADKESAEKGAGGTGRRGNLTKAGIVASSFFTQILLLANQNW